MVLILELFAAGAFVALFAGDSKGVSGSDAAFAGAAILASVVMMMRAHRAMPGRAFFVIAYVLLIPAQASLPGAGRLSAIVSKA